MSLAARRICIINWFSITSTLLRNGRLYRPESRFPFLRADPDSPKHMPSEPQVTKTASGESKRNICPLARWGMEHLSAYKGGFATRTSDLKRSAGKVLRAAPLRHPMRPSHFKSKRTFNLSSRSPVHIGVLFPAFKRGAKAHDTSVYEVRGISTCARVLESQGCVNLRRKCMCLLDHV